VSLYRHLREHEGERESGPPLPYRFQVEGLVCEGAIGIVYRARDRDMNRTVAVKCLRDEGSSARRRRFEGEAKALARVRHVNVVTLHELIHHGGQLLIVMECLEGRSLDTAIEDGPLDPRRVAEIGRDMARGLAAAHEVGVLHRDVKPGNVLLTDDGRTCLVDFGLARRVDASQVLTRTGELLGTPAYLAPEQARDASAVDERTDLYGLGATLYVALTGALPLEGQSLPHLLQELLERSEPPDPCRLRPEIPAGLGLIVQRCLHPTPRARYPDAHAAAAALDAYLRGAGVPDRRRGLRAVAGVVAAGSLLLAGALLLPTNEVPPARAQAPPPTTTPGPTQAPPPTAETPAPARLTLPHAGSLGAAFLGGDLLVSASPRQLQAWRLADGAPLWSLSTRGVSWVRASPDERWVALGGAGPSVLLATPEGTRRRVRLPAPATKTVGCWGSAGELIVGADAGGIFQVWPQRPDRLEPLRSLNRSVVAVGRGSERQALLYVEDKQRRLGDEGVPYTLFHVEGDADEPRSWSLPFRPTTLTRGRSPAEWIVGLARGTLFALDLDRPRSQATGELDPRDAVVAPRDSIPEAFATLAQLAPVAHTSAVVGAALLTDSLLVTVAGPRPMAGGDVRVWDLPSKALVGVAITAADGPFLGVAVSRDRRRVALVGEGQVQVFPSEHLLALAQGDGAPQGE
jgi:predicted Ser/Thr protein kinase